MATTREPSSTATAPPEPELTPSQLIARAIALRPKLVERQAETEARRYYSQETHDEFRAAGFYRTLIPRRFGGYEFDFPTFTRLVIELAHGCPSSVRNRPSFIAEPSVWVRHCCWRHRAGSG